MTPQLSADTEILKVLARYKASADKIESAHDWSDAKRDAAVDRMDRAFAKVIGLPVNTAEAAVAAIDFLCTAHRYGELSAFPCRGRVSARGTAALHRGRPLMKPEVLLRLVDDAIAVSGRLDAAYAVVERLQKEFRARRPEKPDLLKWGPFRSLPWLGYVRGEGNTLWCNPEDIERFRTEPVIREAFIGTQEN